MVFPQEEELYLKLEKPGIQRYGILIANPSREFPQTTAWMETLVRDLVASDAFKIIPHPMMGEKKKLNLKKLQEQGADFVLETQVEALQPTIIFKHQVLDTKTGKIVLLKRYKSTSEMIRAMAHKLADELILYFTGRKGVSQTRIAFVSDRSGYKELYVMDADGSNIKPLTKHQSLCLSPAWSPDGKRIAFSSFALKKPALFLLLWQEGKSLQLPTGLALNSAPSFDPTGTLLLFAGSVEGNSDIYMMDLNTLKIQRMTHTLSLETNPVFSPNGQEIIFTSDRSGTPQLYMMNRDGINIRRLTHQGSYNDEAVWSPDGRFIAYASRQGNTFKIKLLELATGLEAELTGEGSNESPSFSPDGKRIAFASNRSGSYQIYTMNLDGSRILQLTKKGNNTSPAWSPYLP